MQVIGGEAELTAEETKGTAHHMAAHTDAGILAQRDDGTPLLEQRAKGFPDRRSGFDRDGAHPVVVVDAFHR